MLKSLKAKNKTWQKKNHCGLVQLTLGPLERRCYVASALSALSFAR